MTFVRRSRLALNILIAFWFMSGVIVGVAGGIVLCQEADWTPPAKIEQ